VDAGPGNHLDRLVVSFRAAFEVDFLADVTAFFAADFELFAAVLTFAVAFFIKLPDVDLPFVAFFPALLPATPPTIAPTAAPSGPSNEPTAAPAATPLTVARSGFISLGLFAVPFLVLVI